MPLQNGLPAWALLHPAHAARGDRRAWNIAGRFKPRDGVQHRKSVWETGHPDRGAQLLHQPYHPDADERKRQIELFKEHARFVRDFGCGIVATETGPSSLIFPSIPGITARSPSSSCWRALVSWSRGRTIWLSRRCGGVANFVVCDPGRIRRMLDSSARTIYRSSSSREPAHP